MNKVKYVLSFILVVLATVAIVLIPDMVQAEKYKVYAGQQQVWQYDFNKGNGTLTAAKAYEIYADDIRKSVSDTTEIVNGAELQRMKTNAVKKFKTVFGSDKKLWEDFRKSLVENTVAYCQRATILRAEDFEVYSLNIVSIYFSDGSGIVYEEKTSAIFEMFCVIENSENGTEDYRMFCECVDEYYADSLEGLNVKPYFSPKYNKNTTAFSAGVAMMESELDKIESEYQSIIQN